VVHVQKEQPPLNPCRQYAATRATASVTVPSQLVLHHPLLPTALRLVAHIALAYPGHIWIMSRRLPSGSESP